MRFNGAVTFSLRKFDTPIQIKIEVNRLQWGRNFFVTEICIKDTWRLWVFQLQWGRNFFVTEIIKPIAALSLRSSSLQWGRNFFVTEIMYFQPRQMRTLTLQWGRNFFVTEIPYPSQYFSISFLCFNGAVTFSLRKFGKIHR